MIPQKEPWNRLILKVTDFFLFCLPLLSDSIIPCTFFVTVLSHSRHILVLDALKTDIYPILLLCHVPLPTYFWLFSSLTFPSCHRTSCISFQRPWLPALPTHLSWLPSVSFVYIDFVYIDFAISCKHITIRLTLCSLKSFTREMSKNWGLVLRVSCLSSNYHF